MDGDDVFVGRKMNQECGGKFICTWKYIPHLSVQGEEEEEEEFVVPKARREEEEEEGKGGRVSFPDNKQGSLGSYSPPPSFKSSHIMAHLVSKQPNCVSSTTFLAFSPLSNLLCSVPFYSLAHGAPSSSNSSLSAPPRVS